MAEQKRFFSCDWGSSSFRLRLVRRDALAVVDEVRSDAGAVKLTQRGTLDAAAREKMFVDYLREPLAVLARRHGVGPTERQVVVSGMASSSVGWRELDYAPLPAKVDGMEWLWAGESVTDADGQMYQVMLVSGVCSKRDVMRGEEVQVTGLFTEPALAPLANRCVVVLPGTHSKHIVIEAGRMTTFTTYMTGELFDLLARQSVLRHSVVIEPKPLNDHLWAAFDAGTANARGHSVLAGLFGVRVKGVFGELDRSEAGAYLSGLLIGTEVEALLAERGDWPVVVAATGTMGPMYERVIKSQWRGEVHVLDSAAVDMLAVRGHAALLRRREHDSE